MTDEINSALLRRDIEAALANGATARGISMKASNGRNPDLVRDFLKRGRNKRITGQLLVGLAAALETTPSRYTAKRQEGDDVPPIETQIDAQIAELLNPETIARLMGIAMRVGLNDQTKRADLLVYAHGIAAGLRRLARSPANRDNPGYLEAVDQDVLDAVAGGRR
jgi:hypothetical protein